MKRLIVTLSDGDWTVLKDMAEKIGVSRADIVRLSLRLFVKTVIENAIRETLKGDEPREGGE
jgi:hypothetical protein